MKIFTGKVVSDRMQRTVKVVVERVVTHPVYGKRFKRNKSYLVHDEYSHKIGDVVNFTASKPYSRMKKWRVLGEKTTANSLKTTESKEKEKANGAKKIVVSRKVGKKQ